MVCRSEVGDEARLGAVCDPVENLHVEAPLHAEQRSEEADRLPPVQAPSVAAPSHGWASRSCATVAWPCWRSRSASSNEPRSSNWSSCPVRPWRSSGHEILLTKEAQVFDLGFYRGAKENRTPDLFHAMNIDPRSQTFANVRQCRYLAGLMRSHCSWVFADVRWRSPPRSPLLARP